MNAEARRTKYGPCALVTGAASGIGQAFARELAGGGFELALVDRDAAGLEAMRRELGARTSVTVHAVDLTDDGSIAGLVALASEREVGLVVHAAGITSMGEFLDIPVGTQEKAIALHCMASFRLMHAFGGPMRARRRGGLVLLSSNSAILRAPYVATYAATKAFTLALAESLYEELRAQGVDVLALVPGMTDTPMFRATGADAAKVKGLVQPADEVARGALAALGSGPVYISSAPDRFAASVMGTILPRKLALRLARRSMEHFFPALRK